MMDYVTLLSEPLSKTNHGDNQPCRKPKQIAHWVPLRITKHCKPKQISHIGSHNKPFGKTKSCDNQPRRKPKPIAHDVPLRKTKHCEPKQISHFGSHGKPPSKNKHCTTSPTEQTQVNCPRQAPQQNQAQFLKKNPADAMVINFGVKMAARIGNWGT